MTHPTSALTAQQIVEQASLGAIIAYSDGAPEPPKRFTRKHAEWRRDNGRGLLVEKSSAADKPAASPARFTLLPATTAARA